MPEVSVVIPCYNAGTYLQEAVNSVHKNAPSYTYEIIITDDGSTVIDTKHVLESLEQNGCKIIYQENKGPAAARNAGVRASAGKYLFFLDSDNRVRKGYINKGVKVLEANKTVGVVYGKPYFFGDTAMRPRFVTTPFDLNKLLFDNYIDTCTVMRRQVWDDVNGFDEARVLIAHEDWELWIRVALRGWKFYFIDDLMFDYRVVESSLVISAIKDERHQAMREYVFKKHLSLFIDQYRIFAGNYFAYENDRQHPLRSFIKYLNLKRINMLK